MNERKSYMMSELGADINFIFDDATNEMKLGGRLDIQVDDPETFKIQNEWFQENLNKFSNTLRPLLKEFSASNSK